MRILIKNASLVFEDRVEKGDLLTEGRRIVQVGGNIDAPADQVIDGSGCFVFPGFIDTHTHFDLEVGSTVTADDFISGTKAAVVGGTTTVLDFATQERGMTMMDAFQKWSKKAEGSSCHYGFHMAVSEWNEDRIAEIPQMIENGVTSFKMYMVYDNMRVSDGQIYQSPGPGTEGGGEDLFSISRRFPSQRGGSGWRGPAHGRGLSCQGPCLGGASVHQGGFGHRPPSQGAGAGGVSGKLSPVSGAGGEHV